MSEGGEMREGGGNEGGVGENEGEWRGIDEGGAGIVREGGGNDSGRGGENEGERGR